MKTPFITSTATLADRISTAIQNARLHEEAYEVPARVEVANRQFFNRYPKSEVIIRFTAKDAPGGSK